MRRPLNFLFYFYSCSKKKGKLDEYLESLYCWKVNSTPIWSVLSDSGSVLKFGLICMSLFSTGYDNIWKKQSNGLLYLIFRLSSQTSKVIFAKTSPNHNITTTRLVSNFFFLVLNYIFPLNYLLSSLYALCLF